MTIKAVACGPEYLFRDKLTAQAVHYGELFAYFRVVCYSKCHTGEIGRFI